MPYHASPARDRACSRSPLVTMVLVAATIAPLISGCSNIDVLGETPSTTRFPVQWDVPTLDAEEGTDAKLDHATCVSPRLHLSSSWPGDTTVVDSSGAVFVEGGLKAQGAPVRDGGTAIEAIGVMPQIHSARKNRNQVVDVTVRTVAGAWASVVTNPDANFEQLPCTSPRIESATATTRGQFIYRLTCPTAPTAHLSASRRRQQPWPSGRTPR